MLKAEFLLHPKKRNVVIYNSLAITRATKGNPKKIYNTWVLRVFPYSNNAIMVISSLEYNELIIFK